MQVWENEIAKKNQKQKKTIEVDDTQKKKIITRAMQANNTKTASYDVIFRWKISFDFARFVRQFVIGFDARWTNARVITRKQ